MSLYTWTKSIAAGAFLVPVLLAAMGRISWDSPILGWGAPIVAGIFLALTGALLVWDLEHPKRFLYVLIKPQFRSWLVRGGFVITAYGAVLAALFLGNYVDLGGAKPWLLAAGVPLAAMTSVYTAFLFAQAKARDLWQSPLLPPHLLVQAVMAGSGVMLIVPPPSEPELQTTLGWLFAVSSALHLLLVLGETTMTHVTAHAHMALHEMVRGRFARFFWSGMLMGAAGLLAVNPTFAIPAALAGLAGLLAFEHAYVQAGQSVPLA